MWAHKCNYVIINTPDVNMYHLYDDRRIYWNFHQLLWKTHGSKFPLRFASSWQVSDKLASLPRCAVSERVVIYHIMTLQRQVKGDWNQKFSNCFAGSALRLMRTKEKPGNGEKKKISFSPPLGCDLGSTQDVTIIKIQSSHQHFHWVPEQEIKGLIFVPCF